MGMKQVSTFVLIIFMNHFFSIDLIFVATRNNQNRDQSKYDQGYK